MHSFPLKLKKKHTYNGIECEKKCRRAVTFCNYRFEPLTCGGYRQENCFVFLNEREKTWRWDGARFCLEVHVEHVDEIKIKVEMNLKMFV